MAKKNYLTRLKRSLAASSGEVVFGMEDGTVSILGLVLGVAAGGYTSGGVVLAGATAAIAASVSMMAGCFLEIESQRDEAGSEIKEREEELGKDPEAALSQLVNLLHQTRLSETSIDAIRKDIGTDARALSEFEITVASHMKTSGEEESPIIHSSWMFISDLIAGLTPVIPFVFFPLETAWMICIIITGILLALLGVGRARIGHKGYLRSIGETMGIAASAAVAGVLVGRFISMMM